MPSHAAANSGVSRMRSSTRSPGRTPSALSAAAAPSTRAASAAKDTLSSPQTSAVRSPCLASAAAPSRCSTAFMYRYDGIRFQGRTSMLKLFLSAVAAALFPAMSLAQSALPVSGQVMLASEYRFRGIDQTFGEPALQGGVDYSHPSGLYFSNWNSNVHPNAGYPNANLEMDLYGGWKRAFGEFGLDIGAIYYMYPGSDPSI